MIYLTIAYLLIAITLLAYGGTVYGRLRTIESALRSLDEEDK